MTHDSKRTFLGQLVCLSLFLSLVFTGAASSAQVSTGTMLGSVIDPSGANVPGATVTITNLDTNIASVATTNESGRYTVPNLQAGQYKVILGAAGFNSEEITDVVLDVGSQKEVNFTLKIGRVSDTVVVTDAAPNVELASSTVMPVVNQATVVELPLNGRDYVALATLQPGVLAARSQPTVAVTNQRANRGVGNQLSISGARPQMNNYRVDGISINDYSNGGPGGVNGGNIGVDAIQEFSVVTGNATADYGKTAGGVINAVTRTGGNKYHGSVYEFLRNSALDTRNQFDLPGQIAPFRRNQFGASLGGPIIRDRTFLFGNYEGLRQTQSLNVQSVVPSAAARTGALVAGKVAVSPAVAPYLLFYPLPNSTVSGDSGLFLFNNPTITAEDYVTIRGDHKLSGKDQIGATFFRDSGTIDSPDPLNVRVSGNIDKRYLGTVSEAHSFSATLLNTARIGYSRVVSDAPTTLAAVNPMAADVSLGFAPNLPAGLINIGGIANFQGGLGATGEFLFHYNSYQGYDDVYWSLGKHTLKMGFAYEWLQNNQLGTSNPNGQYIFGSLSAFLQNQPTSFSAPIGQTTSPKDLRQSVIAGYITDDYHLYPNLTLNLGVRYEFATVTTETRGRLSNLPTLTAATPNLGSPFFQNPTKRNFAPRVGLAWDPFREGKTSVRAAYGIYDALPLNYLYEGLSVFAAPFFVSGSVNTASTLAGTFPKNSYPLLTPATLRYSYTPQNPSRSYVQQYGASVQQQLPFDMTIQVGYQGSHGVHLPFRVDDINTVQPLANLGGGAYEFPSIAFGATAPLKLNPNVGQISAMLPIGFSKYNALQAQLSKRLSKHLQLQAAYTWQKSVDDGSSSTFGDTFANSVSSLPYFAKDRRIGLSDFNVTDNFVFNYLVFLPDVPKAFGPAGFLLNGWQYGGIFQASTGLPLTPLISGDPLGLLSNDTFGFPNRIFTGSCSGNPVNKQSKTNYIRKECFTYPQSTPGYNPMLGNSPRNSVFGPGYQNFDMSLIKNTRIKSFGELFNIQFRAEIFNILNRSNYSIPLKASMQLFTPAPRPTAAVPNPSPFGGINSSSGTLSSAANSRQAQFAVKILF